MEMRVLVFEGSGGHTGWGMLDALEKAISSMCYRAIEMVDLINQVICRPRILDMISSSEYPFILNMPVESHRNSTLSSCSLHHRNDVLIIFP